MFHNRDSDKDILDTLSKFPDVIGVAHCFSSSYEVAKKLIDVASVSGCNAVKFQKRTIDVVYSTEELDVPRESPWGTTNRDQKFGLEFSEHFTRK